MTIAVGGVYIDITLVNLKFIEEHGIGGCVLWRRAVP